jgi:hypothetical protein
MPTIDATNESTFWATKCPSEYATKCATNYTTFLATFRATDIDSILISIKPAHIAPKSTTYYTT